MRGFHNNSSNLTLPNSEFPGWLKTTYYRHGNKWVAKRLWACAKAERLHSNTCCNFWHRTLFRQKQCYCKRFYFSVHKATSAVEWRVLEDCYGNRFSWYTAV